MEGEPGEFCGPASQDSPLPIPGAVSFALVEPLARRFVMVAVGDSLRAQPPIRAIERTERMARIAIEPFLLCSSPSGTGVEPRETGGAGDGTRARVWEDEIDENGRPCVRILDGCESGIGATEKITVSESEESECNKEDEQLRPSFSLVFRRPRPRVHFHFSLSDFSLSESELVRETFGLSALVVSALGAFVRSPRAHLMESRAARVFFFGMSCGVIA